MPQMHLNLTKQAIFATKAQAIAYTSLARVRIVRHGWAAGAYLAAKVEKISFPMHMQYFTYN